MFKPTSKYKEYMVLDMISKNKEITQREIADNLSISVSSTNDYINKLESEGYVVRLYFSTKTVEYNITKEGIKRLKFLNIGYLSYIQKLYDQAKYNIIDFLKSIEQKYKKILLYGAGEVCEIILNTLYENKNININVLAIIDDDENKQNEELLDTDIIAIDKVKNYNYDGILISSFSHHKKLIKNLLKVGVEKEDIIEYF